MPSPVSWLETRLQLAHLPTPLVPLPGPLIVPEARVWVKRDDATGSDLTGNKVRKLEFLLADALANRCTAVMTTGGIQSNHARATALAARRLGLDVYLLLRGTAPQMGPPEGNLLLDAWAGARIRWVTPEQYRRRDALMAEWKSELARASVRCAVIAEGGSCALGSRGYVRAGFELAAQADWLGVRFDTVVTACGSGGTAAGLLAAHLMQPDRVPRPVAVPVCDDAATFRPRVRGIAAELLCTAGERSDRIAAGAALDWLDGFVGPGYAQTSPEQIRHLHAEAKNRGLVLDPTYTGKAWQALLHTLRTQPGRLGRNVVFLHTGGLPSLFAWGRQIADAIPAGGLAGASKPAASSQQPAASS